MAGWSAVEDAVTGFVGRGSHQGSTWFGRLGDIVQQPPLWAGLAGALAMAGTRGRRAALRGSACYTAAAVLSNFVIKPIVGRSRPPRAGRGRVGPATSSLPSGHAATDLAFSLGASQELPWLFLPFSLGTLAAHWSLVRSRGHYPSDVLIGGALGVGVALAVWRLWPPGGQEVREET
jgi:membrane-associated phospholipid phosphatase